MKKNSKHLVCALALCLAALAPNSTFAQAPAGIYNLNISDPTNSVWDVSLLSELSDVSFSVEDVDIKFPTTVTQDGKGKLTGAGDTTVSLDEGSTIPDFPGTYNLKGAISSSQGVGHLSFSATVSGLAYFNGNYHKATASEKASVVIDSVTRQIVSGSWNSKASLAGAGSGSDGGPIDPEPLPDELGNGSWKLELNLQPDAKNKFSGVNNSATVTLATGRVYTFAVLGSYKPTTQQSKLVLKGTGDATGSSLKITMLGSDITSIIGKISGQAISLK